MPYFAAALLRSAEGWTGQEFDLDEVEDFDDLVDRLRDVAADEADTVLFVLEEDDEYLGVVRVDGHLDARVFLSDVRAASTSGVAELLAREVAEESVTDDDDDAAVRPEAEPGGDTSLLADLGTSAATLLALCAEEGMLPADVLTSICEEAGCADILESLR